MNTTKSCMNWFNEYHPEFSVILFRKPCVYIEEEFKNFGEILISNIANMDEMALLRVEFFLDELHGDTNEEEVRGAIYKLIWDLEDRVHLTKKHCFDLHDNIVGKISKVWIHENSKSILTPYYIKYIPEEYEKENLTGDLASILWQYRKNKRMFHYLLMLYIYELTLKMQVIKGHLIKYDIARNGKQSGTALDIIIMMHQLQYKEMNEEFKLYNKELSNINYYHDDFRLFPNNHHLRKYYKY